MRARRRLVVFALLGAAALACPKAPRAPTLAAALAPSRARARDLRVIGMPPWARLAGIWGSHPITHGAIEMAAFTADGRLVTLSENDGSLRVWDVPSRRPIAAYDHCPPPPTPAAPVIPDYNRYSMALSADGRLAAVAHGKGNVCVRRLDDGTITSNFHTGASGLRYLGFWGATRLVTYQLHGQYGLTSELPPCVPNCPEPPPDGFIRVWDVGTGTRIAELHVGDLPSSGGFGRPALTASLDGGRLVVPKGNEISALDLATMKPVWTKRLAGPIWATGLSSGDRVVVASGRETSRPGPHISQLALADGSELSSADVPPFDLVALDPRGGRAVVREADEHDRPFRETQLWDVPAMKVRRMATNYSRPDRCSNAPLPKGRGVFSPDGSVLATWWDGITLWDVDTLTPIVEGSGACSDLGGLAALSPDGSRALLIRGDETVRELRVSDGTELHRWRRRASRATYAPDGTMVLLGGGTVVPLLDVATGKTVWEADGRLFVAPFAFSPDGRLVATVGARDDLTVHDARTGKALWSHGPGRSAPTHQIVFTPDSRYVVANADDLHLAVWEARTGRFVRGLGRSAQTIAMRGDGALIFQDYHSVVSLPVDGGPAAVTNDIFIGDSFALTPDGRRAFVAEGGRVTLRPLDGGADLGSIDLGPFDDTADGLALSRDGRRLLVGTRHGVILNVTVAAPDQK